MKVRKIVLFNSLFNYCACDNMISNNNKKGKHGDGGSAHFVLDRILSHRAWKRLQQSMVCTQCGLTVNQNVPFLQLVVQHQNYGERFSKQLELVPLFTSPLLLADMQQLHPWSNKVWTCVYSSDCVFVSNQTSFVIHCNSEDYFSTVSTSIFLSNVRCPLTFCLPVHHFCWFLVSV